MRKLSNNAFMLVCITVILVACSAAAIVFVLRMPVSNTSPSTGVGSSATPSAKILNRKPSELVISLSDMPEGFVLERQEELTNEQVAQTGKDPQATLDEFKQQGRVTSYVIQGIMRQVTIVSALIGAIGVVHQVIQYGDVEGAIVGQESIYINHMAEGAEAVSIVEMGDKTLALVRNDKVQEYGITTYIIIVRYYNYLSIVDVNGPKGGVVAQEALKIARVAAKRFD